MATENTERMDFTEEDTEQGLARRAVLRGLGGASLATLIGALLTQEPAPAAAQSPATATAGTSPATPTLDAIAALPGVIVAIEWDATGKLIASRSKLPLLPKKQLELAAQLGALVTNAFPMAVNLYSEVLGMKWQPARWVAASGGRWLLIFGAHQQAVLADAGSAGLPEVFAALGGTPTLTGTPTP